jgi:hypothetical protein
MVNRSSANDVIPEQEMRRERKGERLSLTDLLAKPHQRIPRYRLLIQVHS